MKRYTSASVIAMELCWDISELNECRYQAGRSDKPIYSIGDKYYCASPLAKKPAKHWTIEFEWERYNSKFAESIGWQIWVSDNK